MQARPAMAAAVLGLLCLVTVPAPALAVTDDLEQPLCRDYDTQQEAQVVLEAGAEDPQYLDRDGDGTACEDDEVVGGGPVACPPEEASDLVLARPGSCPDAERVMPSGGMNLGGGTPADGSASTAAGGTTSVEAPVTGLVAVVALALGGTVLLRRHRAAD